MLLDVRQLEAPVVQAASLVDSAPLYAGVGVARIVDVRPAAELVAALTP